VRLSLPPPWQQPSHITHFKTPGLSLIIAELSLPCPSSMVLAIADGGTAKGLRRDRSLSIKAYFAQSPAESSLPRCTYPTQATSFAAWVGSHIGHC